MTLPRTTADVLSDHVLFEIESVDRMYLNVYQSRLQYGGGVSAFFVGHRGHKYASSVLMAPITEAFVANIHHFIAARGLDLLSFGKDAIAHKYLAAFPGKEGVLFVGRARRGPRRRRSSTPGRSRWTRSHLPPESIFPRARRGRSLPWCGELTFRTPPRHRVPEPGTWKVLIPGDGAAGDQGAQNRRACPVMAATQCLRAVPSQRLPGAMISGAPAVL